MSKGLPVTVNGKQAYTIIIREDFSQLKDCVKEITVGEGRICIVTDSNVEKLYAPSVLDLLKDTCKEISLYTIPAGEEHKNLEEIQKIYVHLIEHHLDRNDLLIALGGGVTGDMTGFAAATYLRGIRFVQIPTTLLSQVDSSIGGKTGVDFDQYKNMVGAFHMPSLVYINVSTLATLTEEQFASGMGEVLKHGLIKDAAYYEWTIEHMDQIRERDSAVLRSLVETSCRIKREVVQNDPQEKGERALLNFGHTIGHAIEKEMHFRYPHGHCVALGYTAAAYISWKRGYLSSDDFYEIRDMNVGFDLPITFDGISSEAVLKTTKLDKKMRSGHIRFILLKQIGAAYIDTEVTDQEILAAINTLNCSADTT